MTLSCVQYNCLLTRDRMMTDLVLILRPGDGEKVMVVELVVVDRKS